MAFSSFRFPTDIRFGAGVAKNIPAWLKAAGKHRPLLVTDRGLAENPICRDLLAALRAEGLQATLYAESAGNPVESHVTKGTALFQKTDCDSVIMLGGGCPLDVGKAIALMARHPGKLFDYEDGSPDCPPIDKDIPYMLAIPTTAGTGSEVGGSSVISDDTTHAKYIIWSPRLIPRLVVADPELTVGLPAAMTAATGIDALTHNIEAYLAKNYHPICDGIALEGIRLVFNNLEKAVHEPKNLEARGAMLMASMMGAIAFQKGLGVTHSCAHALSTCFDMHHGLANAMMMLPCMKFNKEVRSERFEHMARVIGHSDFIAELESLKKRIGIPTSLKALGVTLNEHLIDVAFADTCHSNNPRTCSREDFTQLFREALNV